MYPYGIANIRREDFIGLNEAGLFDESSESNFWKCYIGKRLTQACPYSKSVKWTLFLAILGNSATDRCKEMWS